jgi:hypothetical protein
MRGHALYVQYHRLIDELAQSAGPETDWQAELRACIDKFEADAAALDSRNALLLREDLSAQLEHEGFQSRRSPAREILFAAVKWLELGG